MTPTRSAIEIAFSTATKTYSDLVANFCHRLFAGGVRIVLCQEVLGSGTSYNAGHLKTLTCSMKIKAKPPRPSSKVSGAESSRKVLSLLMSFHQDRPIMTVEQLADEIKVPMSTAYRYVMLLRDVGLLEASKTGIQVSPRAIELAKAAIAANGVIQLARPVLEALRDQTGEGTRLTRRLNDVAVCIDQVGSGQPVRLTFEPGEPKPLYGGASSKVLLAHMPDAELKRYLARLPKLLTSKNRRDGLITELPAIRKQGWAVSEGEIDNGVWAAAAHITNGRHVVAALSVAAPAYRLTRL